MQWLINQLAKILLWYTIKKYVEEISIEGGSNEQS